MAFLYIKKFHFKHNGALYSAGEFLDIDDSTAADLVAGAPDEFAIITNIEKADNFKRDLEDLTMQELRTLAADKGLDTSKARSKADVKKLILQAEEVALPDVDPAAGIKNG